MFPGHRYDRAEVRSENTSRRLSYPALSCPVRLRGAENDPIRTFHGAYRTAPSYSKRKTTHVRGSGQECGLQEAMGRGY